MSVTLTDDPRIVALKAEYRRLDEREEWLKTQDQADPCVQRLRELNQARKSEIAGEIFELKGQP